MLKQIRTIFGLIAVFLIVLGAFNFLESKFFYIKEIEIVGNNELIKDDILKHFEKFKGKPIFFVNTGILDGEILKDIRVKYIKIEKDYPNKLKITLDQREAVAYTRIGDSFYLVDEDLNIFSKLGELRQTEFPIIYYDEKTKDEASNVLKKLVISNMYNLTSEIYKEDKYYNIILNSGGKVMIRPDVSVKKLNQGVIVYQKEMELQNNIEYIDLRFESVIVK